MIASVAAANNQKRRVLLNSLSGALTLLINLTFILWLYQYLLRRLPPDEFAVYPVLIVVMTLVPVLASFFSSALSRNVIEAYSRDDRRGVTVLHSSAVLMLAMSLPVLLLVGAIAARNIDSLINVPPGMIRETQVMFLVLCADVAVLVFGIPFSTAFEVAQRFVWRDAILTTGNLLRIGLTGIMLLSFGAKVIWLPIASLAADVFTFLLIWISARRISPDYRVRRELFSWTTVRGLISFGFWTSLGTISLIFYQSAGPVILNLLSTAEQVNSFFVGSVIDRRILGLMTVALAPVLPVLTTMSVTGDFSRLGNTYLRGGRYALWASMAVGAPLFVYADDFIDLYLGPTYAEAAVVMMIFLSTFPITYADVMLSRVAIAKAELRPFFLGAIISTMAMVVVGVIVVGNSDSGAVGMALSLSAVNVVAHLAFFWPYGLRLAGVTRTAFVEQTLVRGLLPTAAGLIVWYGLRFVNPVDSWTEFFAHTAGGFLIYVVVLVGWCLQDDERRGINRLFATARQLIAPGKASRRARS